MPEVVGFVSGALLDVAFGVWKNSTQRGVVSMIEYGGRDRFEKN